MRSSPNAQLVPEVAHSRQFQKAPNRLEIAHIGNNENCIVNRIFKNRVTTISNKSQPFSNGCPSDKSVVIVFLKSSEISTIQSLNCSCNFESVFPRTEISLYL
jgi:hypothetical protein